MVDADTGARRIAWARANMPLLANARDSFQADKPLTNLKVAMGLHVESKTAVLAEVLVAGGADLSMTGSPGTTDDDVAAALRRDLGIPVLGRRDDTFDDHLAHIATLIEDQPDVLIDNGADLISAALNAGLETIRYATEETTSGVQRLRGELNGRLPYPVITINESPLKQIVENEKGIGPAVLDGFMRATNTMVSGRTFCVVGYGSCGRSLARTLRALNAVVLMVEVNPIRAMEAAFDGMIVMPIESALPLADVVFTVAASPGVITENHFPLLRDRVMLANVGHFSTEIDTAALRSSAVSTERLAPHIEEFVLTNGRRVRLLARGDMLNLAAGTGHAIEVMDVGFALQAHSVLALAAGATRLTPGENPVPDDINRLIAAKIVTSLSGHFHGPIPHPQQT